MYKSIVRTSVPFMCVTSYKDQFKPFEIKQIEFNPEIEDLITSRSKVPDYAYRSPIKFEGSSAYKNQF